MNQNTRINAAIAYFFLSPFFLLAKKGTPLAHEFVQSHARRSSLQLLIAIIIFVIIYSLSSYLRMSIFGIVLYDVVMAIFLILLFLLQFLWAYRAFNGQNSGDSFSLSLLSGHQIHSGQYSDEEKIKISMSFVPVLSIFIAQKTPMPEILIGRKLSNFFLFISISLIIILNTSISFILFALLVAYIILAVTTSVRLFVDEKFLFFDFYKFIPSYHQFEARIAAFFVMIVEFFRVAFGKEKQLTFQSEYEKFLQNFSQKIPPQEKFWTKPFLIGLPIFNFLTVPSFFNKKFHEYQWNIAEWFVLTILVIIAIFVLKNYNFLYLLIFPIATLMAESATNTNVRAPIVSVARRIFVIFYKTKQKIHNLQKNEIEEVYHFDASSQSETKK